MSDLAKAIHEKQHELCKRDKAYANWYDELAMGCSSSFEFGIDVCIHALTTVLDKKLVEDALNYYLGE
jgi:hypothetical protein